MRMRYLTVVVILVLGVGFVGFELWGCQGRTPSPRAARLMMMAAEEAHLITDPRERLMRELNLADFQIRTHRAEDARKTLALAADTLRDAKAAELDEHGRISGWISVSELSRAAEDKAAAQKACNEAHELLTAIQPVGKRCDYALGVAEETRLLYGDAASAQLLTKAGEWAGQIAEPAQRRQALVAFADRLFGLNDFEGGRSVLRRDGDAAWRSDTMLALANTSPVPPAAYDRGVRTAAVEAPAAAGMAPATPVANNSYGKAVNFRETYQNSTYQQQLKAVAERAK